MHPLVSCLLVLLLVSSTGCADQEDASSASPAQAQTTSAEEPGQQASPQLRTPADERDVEQRLQDASLGARVQLALADVGSLSGYAFDTEVNGSRVILRGDVASRGAYERAAEVARDVDGVGEVINEVTVDGQQIATAEPEPEPAATVDTAQVAESRAQDDTSSADEQPPSDEAASQQTEDEAVYHTVRSGQSLWVIARQYDVSISQIRRLNDLGGSNIQPGQQLRIK